MLFVKSLSRLKTQTKYDLVIYLNCVKEWKHQLVVLVCDMDQDDRSQGQSRQDQSCTWDTSCQSYWTTHGPSLTLFHFSWWYSDIVLLYYYLRLGLNCDTEAAWLRGSEAVQQYLMMSQPAVPARAYSLPTIQHTSCPCLLLPSQRGWQAWVIEVRPENMLLLISSH